MNQKLLAEYVKLEDKIKNLEALKEATRTQILEEMQSSKIEKFVSGYGTFSVSRKTAWSYSEAVKKLKEKVKVAEIKEQQTGKAVPVITNYLRFTSALK